ncbi:hypothetical protein I204_06549 [Kwoniella mangroviensis CBS 8886]|uniref:uncharacterized protein n=1 Tax=Kwoniella mangroviensis CBS 8507 TaxID=1296122 RepID=UPI00080CC75A|nr:uncharacterized protein I203_03557 [Kwoniella mangroviensis CBS 8507]OCF66876.1 hypothetical protein I203_03557 [Kwoniella mangroviensis CBS 8507]OCF73318.1 hypothetical protein I204_06549 [Kwoniella mangroviensis CBS 8886]
MMKAITHLIFFLLCLFGIVRADTEIINFSLPLPPPSPSSTPFLSTNSDLLELSPSQPTIVNLTDSSPNQSFILNFQGLEKDYQKWTIRISWPGSSPTKIKIIPPDESFQFSIIGSSLSPRMYHPLIFHDLPYKPADQFRTPISILLEPLILGVIPRTALPTIYTILLAVVITGWHIPHILRLIENIINKLNDQSQVHIKQS